MIPSLSYRRFVALDDLEQNDSCQLRPSITAESHCSLTDHDTLLVGLDFGVERRARRYIRRQSADVGQARDDAVESVTQTVLRCYLSALIEAHHNAGKDCVICGRHEDVRESRDDGLPCRLEHIRVEDVGIANDKV